MKKLVFTVVFFCVYTSVVLAQSDNGQASNGSVYSRLGVGYPVGIANTSANAMGVSGVSFNEPFVGELANPAHWGSTVYGLGSGGVEIQSFEASDGTNTATNTNFAVNQFQLQLPIVRGKFGISGSFSPITQSRFRTFQDSTIMFGGGATSDTLLYGVENTGSGGINRAEMGFGWKISKNISIGYAASIVFMSLNNSISGSFADSSFIDVNYSYGTSGTGFGNRFGTHLRFPKIFSDNDQLAMGATLDLPVTLNAERKKTSNTGLELSNIKEPDLGDGTIKLPLSVSGGISYRPGNLVMIAAETSYEQWSQYSNDFRSTGNASTTFVDRFKWGLGFQYLPYVSGSNKFFSNFKYRFGTSYDTGYLQVQGERINTLKFSFGLGILSPRTSSSSSSIDLSFEYGIRGTNNMDLIKEQIWGVRLSLNLAELMFFRPKLQ